MEPIRHLGQNWSQCSGFGFGKDDVNLLLVCKIISNVSLMTLNSFWNDRRHESIIHMLLLHSVRLCFLVSQVPKVTHTEFCQGRTMRWALAWSFYDDVIVPVSLCTFQYLFPRRTSLWLPTKTHRIGLFWIMKFSGFMKGYASRTLPHINTQKNESNQHWSFFSWSRCPRARDCF